MGGRVMITALEELRMKNIYLTPKRKSDLIKSLSLDEKLLYGAILNDIDDDEKAMRYGNIKELDGELTFGDTTYEDGVEIFNNNKD
jgi:hypothetical protein